MFSGGWFGSGGGDAPAPQQQRQDEHAYDRATSRDPYSHSRPHAYPHLNQALAEDDGHGLPPDWAEESSASFTSGSSSQTSETGSSQSLSEDEEDDDDEDDDDEDDEEEMTWVSWFLSLPGNDWLCEVPEAFIIDDFNTTGLAALVPFFGEALNLVLDRETDESVDADLVESSAQLLYLLIHARWVTTKQGLQAMLDKLEERTFGTCPRVLCHEYPLLPLGVADVPGHPVKLYCRSCQDVYNVQASSRYARLDGAAWGTTAAHLLFLQYGDLHPTILELTRGPPLDRVGQRALYVPRVFGFRVSERAVSDDAPSKAWLRMESGVELRSGVRRA